jgi:demethylmenaquinone methyltransferase/2-methoxy-6-polyprenyl-1,4-benzoquinol methylase
MANSDAVGYGAAMNDATANKELDETVDFGFETVRAAHKSERVREVFDSVASNYDLMNDLMSGGMHRLWKDAFVTWLRPRAGMTIVDLAGGTGDIAFRILKYVGNDNRTMRITVSDINQEMLKVGKDRAVAKGFGEQLEWLCADAENLPIPNQSADAVTLAFGIRNMTDKPAALREAYRILKPGGRFMCLEFSHLALPGLSGLYDKYSFGIVPKIGRYVAKDEPAYQYLVESIRKFPDQETFAQMISNAGFNNVDFRSLSGGIAAMHSGWRV